MKKQEANKILEEMLDSLKYKYEDDRIPDDKKEKIVEEKIKELEIFAREHQLSFTLPYGICKYDDYRFFDGTETVEEHLSEYDGCIDYQEIRKMKEDAGTMFWYHSQYCSY